jgi:hypothetical protein
LFWEYEVAAEGLLSKMLALTFARGGFNLLMRFTKKDLQSRNATASLLIKSN